MLFNVKNISVKYGKVEALRNVSLHAEHGEIVTLIGANGAGKSSLLRTISGLHRLTTGEIWLEQERIDTVPATKIVLMGIAHVPEGRHVFPDMTVLENLLTGAHTRKDNDGIKEDLEMVYDHFPVLKERRHQRAGTLSGGEQQMLAMGRALMIRPKLLLLDEPTMGLAPLMVREIARIIKDVNLHGKSIILVEQNAVMALRIAHRAYVMQVGAVVMEGMSSDLIRNEEIKKAYLGG